MKTALIVLLAAIKAYLPCTGPIPGPASETEPARLRRMADELDRCTKAKEVLVAAVEGSEKFAKDPKAD